MINLDGQIAIVTGATRGIGMGISQIFLDHGATVIGIYHSGQDAYESCQKKWKHFGDRIHFYQCDIADQHQVEQFYNTIEQQFDSIDILVNNAGIRKDSILALMPTEDWQHVLDTNLTGTFLMSKSGVKLMMKKKYGRIINITSPIAHLGFAGQSNYAASKAGQIGMTRSLAKECAKKKITVNCVSPGFISTELLEDLTDEQIKNYKKMVPMRRFGTIEEVAEAVLFLASKKASYITGSVLDINGGI